MNDTKLSKLMALMLRHQPEKFGLKLDSEGWCKLIDLNEVLSKETNLVIGFGVISRIVNNDKKKRYSMKHYLSNDETIQGHTEGESPKFLLQDWKIRANQGHSTDKVSISHDKVVPPELLFHGTYEKAYDVILKEGISKMKRHHVHLTEDFNTAINTGSRRGKPNIIIIEALMMHKNGHIFFRSENGVWLTESVPINYFESTWTQKRSK